MLEEAQTKAMENASNAYKTAGLSANEYMNTANSLASALNQSSASQLDSVELANQAIIDMSDNANKMGTDMSMIQSAYQGFAKQNYTMLDNLKLGYGGTKTEMQRLLKDAEKLTGKKFDISNFADITEAIHAIQTEMGITGTTAKEASTTIQGSINSMKGAWNNLLTAMSQETVDLEGVMVQFTDSVATVGENILPVIELAIEGIAEVVEKILPYVIERIPTIINDVLPQILQSGINIVKSLLDGITQNMSTIVEGATQIIMTLATAIMDMLPQILQAGITILSELIAGIGEMMPELIPMAIDCVIMLVETLIDNIDLLIDAGIQLILALADGLIEALPRLIEKIPVIIEKLFNALIRNFPKIVQAGGQLIGKLIVGIIGSLGTLLSKAPQIISTLVKGIKNGWSTIKSAGKNLIQGLWEGISGSITWLKNKIKGWVGNVTSFIKNLFGIHSPSTLFRDEIGQYLGLGLGEGFEDSLSGVYKDMQKAVDYENTKLSSNLTTSHLMKLTNEDNRQARLESIDNNREVVVNSRLDVDGKEMASVVNRVNAKQRLQYGIA